VRDGLDMTTMMMDKTDILVAEDDISEASEAEDAIIEPMYRHRDDTHDHFNNLMKAL
jgi:hypothetical protein